MVLNLKSKIYSRKDILPNYFEFVKNQKRIGRFSWSQKPYNGKIYFVPCFQLLKKNESGQIEKTQQVYLGEKEGERISAIRNTVIHDAENLGLVPVLELYSDKDSSMEQELANCHAVHDVATYKKRRVCYNQELKCEQATLHSDSTLHCKGKRSLEASCLCQLYFERIQRTCPSLGRFYVC